MSIYLDCAAAGRSDRETTAFYLAAMAEDYANQEALHTPAYNARQRLKASEKELISALLPGNEEYSVLWSTSATECFRILAEYLSGTDTLTSTLEHPALTANFRRLTRMSQLACDRSGKLILPEIPGKFAAVILHHVQSETGNIQDLPQLFAAFPDALKIADSVQSAGKLPLSPVPDIHIVSGVKFGAPGGAAILCRKSCAHCGKLEKHVKKMRSVDYVLSRVNVPLCRTMAFAASRCAEFSKADFELISELNTRLRKKLEELSIFPLLPPETPASPYIANFFLPGILAAVVVRALSERGIHCASGSACAAEAGGPSPALLALGRSRQDSYSGLRISFDRYSTAGDVDFLVSELKNVLKNY